MPDSKTTKLLATNGKHSGRNVAAAAAIARENIRDTVGSRIDIPSDIKTLEKIEDK